MKAEAEHRADIVEVGRRLWQRGYVAANDGNISVRLSENEVLATPTETSKGFLRPEDLAKVDLEGRLLAGERQPSSEIQLHLAVYQERADVCGVVHAHPPTATGFAAAGVALEDPLVTEIVLTLGGIPLTGYATPSTEEVPAVVRPHLQDHDAFLLANHGVLALGRDVFAAYYRLETVEHFAQIALVARQLGGGRLLPPERVRELVEIRERSGVARRRHESCLGCGACLAGWPAGGEGQQGEGDGEEQELRRTIERIARRMIQSLS